MTYVISDIHGEYDQLVTLLEKINLQDDDELYILGDMVDRGMDPIKVIKLLMSIPNCTCLFGNHEVMAYSNLKLLLNEVSEEFLDSLSDEDMGKLTEWMLNGCGNTIKEFAKLSVEERQEVIDFIGSCEAYEELEVNGKEYILVHAGLNEFSPEKGLDEYTINDLVWYRMDYSKEYYQDKIVVTGHTPTQKISINPKPGYIFKGNNNIAIDCGAFAKSGRLAAICLETGEEFYSR